MRRVRVIIFAWKSYDNYVFSKCVTLVIQNATRMRHMSSVACLALQCFFTLSHELYDFVKKEKVIEY